MRTITDQKFRGEEGFILVLALVTLLLLTLFGLWALNSADFENRVAGYAQQAERTFNLSEGGNYAEGSRIVKSRRDWVLEIQNTHKTNQVMLPPNDETVANSAKAFNSFDPTGNSKKSRDEAERLLKNDVRALQSDPQYWPWSNINLDQEYKSGGDAGKAHESDYRYLVTYMYCDTAPLGTDASGGPVGVANSYKYRIQAGAAWVALGLERIDQNGVVESATAALGPYQCE